MVCKTCDKGQSMQSYANSESCDAQGCEMWQCCLMLIRPDGPLAEGTSCMLLDRLSIVVHELYCFLTLLLKSSK